jgi:hypothetical protein
LALRLIANDSTVYRFIEAEPVPQQLRDDWVVFRLFQRVEVDDMGI